MDYLQLQERLKTENGFWVKIKDLNMNERTGCAAKLKINEENKLMIHTLLEDAPAINIYSPQEFAFYTIKDEVILRLVGKGEIYDYWGSDCSESPEEYTKRYVNIWKINRDEFLRYYEEAEDLDLPELKTARIVKKEEKITEEEQKEFRSILGLYDWEAM